MKSDDHPAKNQRVSLLHRRLLQWYRRNERDLPWRGTDDPYAVLVSEIMLQQTQVQRVLELFPRWMKRFPNIHALAKSTRRDVLMQWAGMGYNRRALYLLEIARILTKEHGGTIPVDPAVLGRLPGIGRYTAHAIACFGFHRRVATVDTNVHRVISRLERRCVSFEERLPLRTAWITAEALLPPRSFYNWNQAMMDLGATICTARNPACSHCPLQILCPSSKGMQPAEQLQRPKADIPRRIFRGQIVGHLRNTRGHRLPFRILARLMEPHYSRLGRPWLMDVLDSLKRDNMIVMQHPSEVRHSEHSHIGNLHVSLIDR